MLLAMQTKFCRRWPHHTDGWPGPQSRVAHMSLDARWLPCCLYRQVTLAAPGVIKIRHTFKEQNPYQDDDNSTADQETPPPLPSHSDPTHTLTPYFRYSNPTSSSNLWLEGIRITLLSVLPTQNYVPAIKADNRHFLWNTRDRIRQPEI